MRVPGWLRRGGSAGGGGGGTLGYLRFGHFTSEPKKRPNGGQTGDNSEYAIRSRLCSPNAVCVTPLGAFFGSEWLENRRMYRAYATSSSRGRPDGHQIAPRVPREAFLEVPRDAFGTSWDVLGPPRLPKRVRRRLLIAYVTK